MNEWLSEEVGRAKKGFGLYPEGSGDPGGV